MLAPSVLLLSSLTSCAVALNIRYDGRHDSIPTLSSISYIKPTQSYSESSVSSHPVSSATRLSGYGAPGYHNSTTARPTLSGSPGNGSNSSTDDCAPYWLANIKHQGIASFNPNPDQYKIFRNVRDYGAKGDGVSDDTAAIQRAITEGNRCAPGSCYSSTTTPAIVYFPGGTYVISSSIIDYYYTQIIGNPNCMPILQASSDFNISSGLGLIDGSPYQKSGQTGYGATNTFYRQIRNIVIDTTKIPADVLATGIHWPTAQATSLQNIIFNMNAANGTLHQALLVEGGSGGFMVDLTFNGGKYGFDVGNQQFTTRGLTFNNVDTAINQLWDWGWTYKGVSINNCRVGLNITTGGPSAVNIDSITLIDSEINNTPIGIVTSKTNTSEPPAAGSLYLENVKLNNVGVAVLGPNETYLAGSSGTSLIDAWADGHRYLPNGPVNSRGVVPASKRPSSLVNAQGKYYERSKPQYSSVPLSQFLSARDLGATGNGATDDTAALNAAILKAKNEGKILFMDAGYYKVSGTIYIPPGSKIVGEALATVIFSAGEYFNNMSAPKAIVQVAQPGDQGSVELSDLILSTKGQQKGAILMQYNLGSYEGEPAGLWDVHTRVGGFAGSDLQVPQCEKTPDVNITESNLVQNCIAAFMCIHVTKFASGLYMENNWLWVADHDLDDSQNTQLTIYAGRGLNVEGINGRMWLYGTAVEHHVKYEYQFVDTRDVFMGYIQTETAYYQPNPGASIPFPEDRALSDPVFTPSPNSSVNTVDGWGLRIVRSNNILAYGVGLYSFFDNYSTSCSRVGATSVCQLRILSIEGGRNSYDINLYNLNTVGATQMITRDGVGLALNVDNNSTFVDTINMFRINNG